MSQIYINIVFFPKPDLIPNKKRCFCRRLTFAQRNGPPKSRDSLVLVSRPALSTQTKEPTVTSDHTAYFIHYMLMTSVLYSQGLGNNTVGEATL